MGACNSQLKPGNPADASLPKDILVDVDCRVSRKCRYTTTRCLDVDYDLSKQIVLGTGMSGPVKLAVGRVDGRKYAVKSFSIADVPGRAQVDLRNEVDIYLSMDHPHVVRLEMVYEAKKELHFVMECMEGGELFDRVRSSKTGLPEEMAARAACQMLLAVAYIHKCGVVHRDLKLENFMYERKDSDHLKLIDFGLASFIQQDQKLSLGCGSKHYVAPEVLRHCYTKQVDVWSLGIIVYMLLVGRALFSGTKKEIFGKIKKGQFEWSTRFATLSLQAQDFVRSLLVMDPEARPTPQHALEHPWLFGRAHVTHVSPLDVDVLRSLRSFARLSQCQRNVMLMLAWSLSTEDRARLRQQFLAIDHDASGSISLQEFQLALEESSLLKNSQEAAELFRSLDTDGSDSIEYSEFLAAIMPHNATCEEAALKRTFCRFDHNGDGVVSRAELVNALGKSCPRSEIEDLFGVADTSGDGALDFAEFVAYFRRAELDVKVVH